MGYAVTVGRGKEGIWVGWGPGAVGVTWNGEKKDMGGCVHVGLLKRPRV